MYDSLLTVPDVSTSDSAQHRITVRPTLRDPNHPAEYLPAASLKPLVTMVSYYFPPSTAVGTIRPYRFYKYLRQHGYRCRVVTATPGAGVNPDVIEVPDVPERWRNRKAQWSVESELERMVRHFCLPGHVGLAWSFAASSICERLLDIATGPAVLFSTYPPIGTHLAGLLTKRSTGVPWVADFRDPAVVPGGKSTSALTRYLLTKLEEKTFRSADAVISNVDSAAEEWCHQHPSLKDKLSVIWNGYDPDDGVEAKAIPQRPERVLLHAGNLYGGRNANVVLNSVERLRNAGVAEVANLEVRLLGATGTNACIDASLSGRAAEAGWLKILPAVSPSAALNECETADGLLLLQPHTSVQVPAKLFQYICIGRPVLAVAPRDSAVERLLSRSGVPYYCLYPEATDEENDQKILSYLRLSNEPVKPGAWFTENFDVRNQVRDLTRIIDSVAARRAVPV